MKKMARNQFIKYLSAYILVFFLLIAGIYPVFAYVMGSSNYRIQSDSLNVGGVRQTSTDYIMRDTIGETATGPSASANYKLKAGYQQMQEVYTSVSSVGPVTLLPDINGLIGGTATNDATWVVKTDNAAGFSMSIKASTTPALATAGYSFADYTEADTGTPDYTWSIANTASEFGYSVVAATLGDEIAAFLDDGADCNTGSANNVNSCWYPLATPDYTIINRGLRTSANGESEEVRFQVQAGSQAMQENGKYESIITITVLPN